MRKQNKPKNTKNKTTEFNKTHESHEPHKSIKPLTPQFLQNLHFNTKLHNLQYFNLWSYPEYIQDTSFINLKENYDLFIEGKFLKPSSNKYFPIINPATEEVLTYLPEATEEDINKAIQAAQIAYEKYWSKLNPKQKSKYLFKISKIIQEKSKELACLETLNTGKPIKETLNYDIAQSAQCFFYYAGLADKIQYINKQFPAIGPVAQISPDGNFLTTAQKIAVALTTGNTIILKPSPLNPLTTIILSEIIQEANLPDGVVNIIPGNYPDSLLNDRLPTPPINPPAYLNLIIFDDISIDQAIEATIKSLYLNYSTSINSKILIQESIHQEFVHKLKNRIKTLIVSTPLDRNTDIGALKSSKELEKIKHYIEMGIKEGHELYQKETELPSKGYWYPPSFFANIPPSSKISKEKIPGPIISLTTFITPQEAIQKSNTTPNSITSVWTSNLSRLLHITKQIKSKSIWANTYNQFDPFLQGGIYAHYLQKQIDNILAINRSTYS